MTVQSSAIVVTHKLKYKVVSNKILRFTTWERDQAFFHEVFYKWRDPELEEYAAKRFVPRPLEQFIRALAQERLIQQRNAEAALCVARSNRARTIFIKHCGIKDFS